MRSRPGSHPPATNRDGKCCDQDGRNIALAVDHPNTISRSADLEGDAIIATVIRNYGSTCM
jgi:hypothetical protein